MVFHLLIQLSLYFHLSEGIEDAFRTAATEVSLLAGTDEFNATELFGVGKIFASSCVTPHYPSFRCSYSIKGIFFHLAAVLLHTLSIPHARAVLHYCATGQEERSMQLPTPSLLSVLTKLSKHTLILNISLLISSSAVGECYKLCPDFFQTQTVVSAG